MDQGHLAEEIDSLGRSTTRLRGKLATDDSARSRGRCHRHLVASGDLPRGLPLAASTGAG
jgi:hypothetical protein